MSFMFQQLSINNVEYVCEQFILASTNMKQMFSNSSGQDVRKLMDKYDVNIYIPPLAQASNIVKISGTENKVNDAMVGMEERIKELEGDKADRVSVVTSSLVSLLI